MRAEPGRGSAMVDEAESVAEENHPESLDDGHGDAFRHIYWMRG
ncbi:hypothetical protein ABZV91_14900 [Nocardia sp. NPDC004568]